jgi:nitroreductase
MTPQEIHQWMDNQIYLALGMLLAECAHRRIDACPMEGFDAAKYDEVLELGKQGLRTVVLCPIGYRAADDKYASLKKIRFGKEEIIRHL